MPAIDEPPPSGPRSTQPVAPSLRSWLEKVFGKEEMEGLAWGQRAMFFALLGAVMGTILDALHVLTHTAGYRCVPIIPGLEVAWYVPVEFTVAGFTVGLTRPWLDTTLRRDREDLPPWQVGLGLVSLVAAWGGSGFLTKALGKDGNGPIFVGLTAVAVLVWAFFDRTPQGILVGLFTAILGVGVEAALVYTGSYYYTYADFLGVPMWLPSLYVVACIAIGNLGRFMKYSWKKQEPVDQAPRLAS